MISAAALGLILTASQARCLSIAYNYGSIYGIPRTYMAVILVESSACVHNLGDDGKSLGPAQIQILTARQTCGCEVSRDRLRTDRNYNLKAGAAFLSRCINKFWPDYRRGLLCYNVGIPAASKATDSAVRNSRYVHKIESAVRALEGVKQNHE